MFARKPIRWAIPSHFSYQVEKTSQVFTHFPKETFLSCPADGLRGATAPLIQWAALVTSVLSSSTIRSGLNCSKLSPEWLLHTPIFQHGPPHRDQSLRCQCQPLLFGNVVTESLLEASGCWCPNREQLCLQEPLLNGYRRDPRQSCPIASPATKTPKAG